MSKDRETILYKIIIRIIKVLFKILYNPTIINKENIPKTGKTILAGNHTSNLDWALLMCTTNRPIHFLAKKELFVFPLKPILNIIGIIPVDRKNKSHKSLVTAEEYLNNNKVIGIFPEGTFPKGNDEMLPFKIGAVKMASDTNCKIIPFAITGKYKLFKNNLKITFGKELTIANKENLEEENTKLRNTVIELMEVK